MSKAEPSSRRPVRKPAKSRPPAPASREPKKTPAQEPERIDTDFGLAFGLAPALRRRPDA